MQRLMLAEGRNQPPAMVRADELYITIPASLSPNGMPVQAREDMYDYMTDLEFMQFLVMLDDVREAEAMQSGGLALFEKIGSFLNTRSENHQERKMARIQGRVDRRQTRADARYERAAQGQPTGFQTAVQTYGDIATTGIEVLGPAAIQAFAASQMPPGMANLGGLFGRGTPNGKPPFVMPTWGWVAIAAGVLGIGAVVLWPRKK